MSPIQYAEEVWPDNTHYVKSVFVYFFIYMVMSYYVRISMFVWPEILRFILSAVLDMMTASHDVSA